MERMIQNLKKEIMMLREKLSSNGVKVEPSQNVYESETILDNTYLHDNATNN